MSRNTPLPSEILALVPYAATLGVEFDEVAAKRVAASLEWTAERCTVEGIMHGGVLMSLADTVSGVLAYLNLPPGATTTTVEFKINFFRAVRRGTLRAAARPLFVGRSFIVVQADLENDQGQQVAQSTQTQAVLATQK